MLYSLTYVSTILLLVLTSMGLVEALGMSQQDTTIFIVIFAVSVSLILTVNFKNGASWPKMLVLLFGVAGFSHILNWQFPLPGGIILTLNLFFCATTWLLVGHIEKSLNK